MNRMMRWFKFDHLPEHLQEVSRPIAALAEEMDTLPEGPEKTAGMRKLLEAKDCFVRARIVVGDDLEPGQRQARRSGQAPPVV